MLSCKNDSEVCGKFLLLLGLTGLMRLKMNGTSCTMASNASGSEFSHSV